MRTFVRSSFVILLFALTLPFIGNAARDFGNLGKLSQHLGGTGDLSSLLERLPDLTNEISSNLPNQQYPVNRACLDELEAISQQLANDTKVYQLSNRCLQQVEALALSGDTSLVQPIPSDDDIDGDGVLNEDDDDIDGDGTPNQDDDDVDGDGMSNKDDDDIDGDGVANAVDTDIDGDGTPNETDNTPEGTASNNENTPCIETELTNTDCTTKVTFNDDDTVSFGDGTNTYERTDEGTFIDTETGEEFTLAEVLNREGVPQEQYNDHSGALDLVRNILDSANPGYTSDPATGAAANTSSSFGDILSSLFGGGSGSGSGSGGPLGAVKDAIGRIPGVGDVLTGANPGGSGNAPGSGTDYSNFDGTLSDYVGDITVVNPDGPSDIIWLDSKNITPRTMSVLEYVSKRVDFPLTVTSTYRPNAGTSQHAVKKAVDLRGRDLTDTQKVLLTQVILSHPDVKGYGTYPGDKSFHFDTRDNKAYWSGPPGSGDYQSHWFRQYCSGSGPYYIHPLICQLVFAWAEGKPVGDVIDEGATKPLQQ